MTQLTKTYATILATALSAGCATSTPKYNPLDYNAVPDITENAENCVKEVQSTAKMVETHGIEKAAIILAKKNGATDEQLQSLQQSNTPLNPVSYGCGAKISALYIGPDGNPMTVTKSYQVTTTYELATP